MGADKAICPDNADTLAGPSCSSTHHGPTKACSEVSTHTCAWGVTTPAIPHGSLAGPETKKPPLCTLSANVEAPNSLTGVQLEQEPGALLTVLGDRSDTGAKVGERKDGGPYALSMLNDLLSIALAGEKLADGPLEAQRVNAMLQQMAAFEPTNELEGMIALQAVAMHRATMDSTRRGLASSRADHRAQYLGQANKCSRTFAALLEQLNRHRGKTTTQKFVFETHVSDGGQAVVGAAVGVGRREFGEEQPHGNTNASGGAQRFGHGPSSAALRGADTIGRDLPSSGGERTQTMPHARRSAGERSAEGQPQQSEAWTLDGGGDAGASAGEQDAERSAQPVGVSQ